MIDHFNSETQTTSMARGSAYPCSTVGQMAWKEESMKRDSSLPTPIKDDRFDDLFQSSNAKV